MTLNNKSLNSGSNLHIPPQPYKYNRSEKINSMKKMKKKWQTSETHIQLSTPFRFWESNKKMIGTTPLAQKSGPLSEDLNDQAKPTPQTQEKLNREESK